METRTIPRPGGGLTIELTLTAEELAYRWPVSQSTPPPPEITAQRILMLCPVCGAFNHPQHACVRSTLGGHSPAIPQDRTVLTAAEVEAWCTGDHAPGTAALAHPSQNGMQEMSATPPRMAQEPLSHHGETTDKGIDGESSTCGQPEAKNEVLVNAGWCIPCWEYHNTSKPGCRSGYQFSTYTAFTAAVTLAEQGRQLDAQYAPVPATEVPPAAMAPLPDETVLAYALRLADTQGLAVPDAQIAVALDRGQVPTRAEARRWMTETRRAMAFVGQG